MHRRQHEVSVAAAAARRMARDRALADRMTSGSLSARAQPARSCRPVPTSRWCISTLRLVRVSIDPRSFDCAAARLRCSQRDRVVLAASAGVYRPARWRGVNRASSSEGGGRRVWRRAADGRSAAAAVALAARFTRIARAPVAEVEGASVCREIESRMRVVSAGAIMARCCRRRFAASTRPARRGPSAPVPHDRIRSEARHARPGGQASTRCVSPVDVAMAAGGPATTTWR